jgi:hypothetical protein
MQDERMPKSGTTYAEKQALLIRQALKIARERRLMQHQCGEGIGMPVIIEETFVKHKDKLD